MRRPSPLLPVFVCLFGFFVAKPAAAAPPCPALLQPGYVSDATQILCVETSTAPGAMTGQITVLVTVPGSSLGDVAVGPDGLLYFTDTLHSKVYSFDPKSSAPSATLVATIPDTNVNGLSFASSNGLNNGDLYVTAHSGVWLIQTACAGCTPAPNGPTEAIKFAAAIQAPGGNAFDVFSRGENETQVIVDQTHGQILQSPFTFPFSNGANFGGFNSNPPTVLASVSKLGQGIFGDFCGDTLVASGSTIQRLSFQNGKLFGKPSTYVDLGATVQYFEVAADNTIIAATFANGAGGVVWSVQPVRDASGVPSSACSAAGTVTKLVSLKSALQAKTPPDLAANVANGVALGPTSITITQNYSVGLNQSNVYNFGPTELIVNYAQVLGLPQNQNQQPGFTQSFTAVRSRPQDISFASPPFQTSTVPIHPSQLGGFAVQYVTPEATFPKNCIQGPMNYQYNPCPPDNSAIQMKSFYSTQDFLNDPGTAGAEGDALLMTPSAALTYTDDPTNDLWLADTGSGTKQPQWTSGLTYVDDNKTLQQTLMVRVQSPVASCGTTTTPTCNPQFNIGQSVTFKITFSPAPTVAPIARLSIAQVQVAADGTIQFFNNNPNQTVNVFSKNNVDVGNMFNCSASLNQCTYNWDSSGAALTASGLLGPGLYQATIFSDSFTPVTVYLRMK